MKNGWTTTEKENKDNASELRSGQIWSSQNLANAAPVGASPAKNDDDHNGNGSVCRGTIPSDYRRTCVECEKEHHACMVCPQLLAM